jgi:hypothetical protein
MVSISVFGQKSTRISFAKSATSAVVTDTLGGYKEQTITVFAYVPVNP